MAGKTRTFDEIGRIFAQFTEQNRERLVQTAKKLLQIQRKDRSALAGSSRREKRPEGVRAM